MTSKEAFEVIKKNTTYTILINNKVVDLSSCFDIVEADLETLELIKSILKIPNDEDKMGIKKWNIIVGARGELK